MTEFRPARFEILPLVVKNLLIINVLFFIAQSTVGHIGTFSIEDTLALHHVKSPLFKPWQIITHLFLHGGIMHLFFNMLALWVFGAPLENMWGPQRFLTFYFLSGIGAALLHLTILWYDSQGMLNNLVYLQNHLSAANLYDYCTKNSGRAGLIDQNAANLVNRSLQDITDTPALNQAFNYVQQRTYYSISAPTVGASGAIFGVLAAFVFLFPNSLIYVYFMLPIKAKWFGLAYFGYELVMGIQNKAGDNVAHWAHIGGGIVGFLLVLSWSQSKRIY